MNKKGMSLPIKALIVLVLLLTILSGIDSILIGLTKESLIGKIIPSVSAMLIAYIMVGLAVLVSAVILSFKVFKK
jgi:uncharacterized membrane protein YuzA (DUF378 family)